MSASNGTGSDDRTIVLFGGGRWARVWFSVIDTHLPSDWQVLWVSKTFNEALRQHLAAIRPSRTVVLLETPDAALAHRPSMAIVATSPRRHAALARLALDSGVDVLVEKPLTLDTTEALALVELAEARNRLLAIDLEFRVAPIIQAFAARLSGRPIEAVKIDWHDPATEKRYGMLKQANLLIPQCWDVYPHLWSLWQALLPGCEPDLQRISTDPSGTRRMTLSWKEIALRADSTRWGSERRRCISIVFADGGNAELDFTNEPGTLRLDGQSAEWPPGQLARPLETVLSMFRQASAGRAPDFVLSARRCLGSIRGAEAAASLALQADAALLRQLLAVGNAEVSGTVERLLLENLLPVLAERDETAAREAAASPHRWLPKVRQRLHQLSGGQPVAPDEMFEVLAGELASA